MAPAQVALNLTVGNGDSIPRSHLVTRMTKALQIDEAVAQTTIDELTEEGLLRALSASVVAISSAGRDRLTNQRKEQTMSTTPTFSPQIIGQTEKALNAILERLLAGTGLTEPQWVTLTVTAASGGAVERDQLVARLVGDVKVSEAQAQARINELAAAHLVEAPEGSLVKLTDAGRRLHDRIRAGVIPITERMWGDLPAEDLATAGRVLSAVLARANAELAGA